MPTFRSLACGASCALLGLLACARDPLSPGSASAAAQDASASAPPTALAVSRAARWTHWLHGEAYADALPALRAPCEAVNDALGAGRKTVACRAGKVSSVSFSHLDYGPVLEPYEYVARFDHLPIRASDARIVTDPDMPPTIAGSARVHVLPNAELIVTITWPTRRVRGVTGHLALDLADPVALNAIAFALGLGSFGAPRETEAWVRALSAKRSELLGAGARVKAAPGKSAREVQLVVTNRGTSALTLSEAPYRSPSTALAVWVNDQRVAPGPPPTPEATPPSFVLAPGASRTFAYDLGAYASLPPGKAIVAPKNEEELSEVVPLVITVP